MSPPAQIVTTFMRVKVREDVPCVVLDGQAVVYEQREDRLLLLDAIATVVWQCCDGEGSVGEIVADLAEAFRADVAVVERDVVALLSDWAERGLLELSTD